MLRFLPRFKPPMKPRSLRFFETIAVAVTASCSADPSNRGNFTTRDSAGIIILTNQSPSLGGPNAWALTDRPDLVIGGENDPTQQLHRVRAAARLESGGLAIANGGTSQVLMYDANGELVRTFGRKGSGPGEFSSLDAIWRIRADSILAWDGSTRQIHAFDNLGRHVRTIQFNNRIANRLERYPNGEFLGFTGTHDTLPRSPNETWWESYIYLRLTSDGDSLGAIGPLHGMEYMSSEWEGSQLRAQRPLGHIAAVAVGPAVFYYGDSESHRVLVFEPGGRLTRIIERVAELKPVTAQVRIGYINNRLGAATDPQLRLAWDKYFAKVPFPSHVPAYRRFDVDPEGNLWVQDWDLPGSPQIAWSVFSPDGHWITEVSGPKGQVLEVGAEHVILLLRNELGMESVVMFRIIKPGRATR
jgi:hypothetical protein